MTLKLCYVDEPWAYFTTLEVKDQWGDDWNDVPYEHNAERPYGPSPSDLKEGRTWDVVRVAYDGPLETPCEGHLNSPYSVEQINAGAVAWLRRSRWSTDLPMVVIPAGETLEEFTRKVRSVGGNVYTSSLDASEKRT